MIPCELGRDARCIGTGCTHEWYCRPFIEGWVGRYIDEKGNLLIPTFRGIPVLPVHLTLYRNAGLKENV